MIKRIALFVVAYLATVFFLFLLYTYAAEPAFQKLKETTVHVIVGSASIVEAPSGRHYMLTCGHVCNAAAWNGIMRANYDDGKLLYGRLVKLDMKMDLCVSEVERGLPALKVSHELKIGQTIYTRGYPQNILSENKGKYVGHQSWDYIYPIEEVGECFKGSDKVRNGNGNIQGCHIVYNDNVTTLYSRPGSSGSPVVNSEGELVGVVSSWLAEKDEAGIVRLEDIQEFLKGL